MDTTLKKMFKDAESQYSENNQGFLVFMILELLKKKNIFRLLSYAETLKNELIPLLQESNKKTSLIPQFKQKSEKGDSLRLIESFFSSQKNILGCPEIDEHILLLSCLKALENHYDIHHYTPVLKEMLKKQLHKIENCCIHINMTGREKEIAEITRVLKRSFRNNVLIIGQTGVGKTTLASSAQNYLDDTKVFKLFPGSDIFLDQVVDIVASAEDQKILFLLDEAFTFEPAHIKYVIDNAQVIATANESAYKKFAAEHPHILSKFEVILLEETSIKDTEKILKNHVKHMQEHYHILYSEDFLENLSQLAKQYISEPAFPAKGISLIEETVLAAQAQGKKEVTTDLLRSIISQKTNIPLGSLTEIDKKDLSSLPDKLRLKVKGQDEAIQKVAQTVQRSRLGFGRKNRPIGSFLFVGPSGVGKTELAKAVAEVLFGDAESMIRLDMSEFSEAHMVQRLIGSPPGYIGYEEGGQLTNPVKQKPYTLILLDEIEKGHPRVFDIFLQVLDDGRLTDGQGKKVDFTNSVIIATSNAGIEEILDMVNDGASHDEISKEIKDILSDYFRIEFINRFDGIIIFNALKPDALKEIAKLQIEKLQIELSKRSIGFSLSDNSLETLAKEGFDPRYGARGLLRLIQERVENKLAEMIINGELKEGQRIEF